jgi:thiamine pyrophosphate-dependent acetolactate synthase large subunit-like protein
VIVDRFAVAPAEIYGRYKAAVEVVCDVNATLRDLNGRLDKAPLTLDRGWYRHERQFSHDSAFAITSAESGARVGDSRDLPWIAPPYCRRFASTSRAAD